MTTTPSFYQGSIFMIDPLGLGAFRRYGSTFSPSSCLPCLVSRNALKSRLNHQPAFCSVCSSIAWPVHLVTWPSPRAPRPARRVGTTPQRASFTQPVCAPFFTGKLGGHAMKIRHSQSGLRKAFRRFLVQRSSPLLGGSAPDEGALAHDIAQHTWRSAACCDRWHIVSHQLSGSPFDREISGGSTIPPQGHHRFRCGRAWCRS